VALSEAEMAISGPEFGPHFGPEFGLLLTYTRSRDCKSESVILWYRFFLNKKFNILTFNLKLYLNLIFYF